MPLRTTNDATLEPDLPRATELVLQLLPIPGRSGQENEVAKFVRRELLRAGATASAMKSDSAHRRSPDGGQTGNLIFTLPGTVRGPRRMLSAHLDTVPICVGSRPVRHGDMVRSANPETGVGADNRAGTAVILTAALEILRRGLPHPPLTFCWFVQEETGLHGSRCLTRKLLGKPAMAFNWDGGSPAKLTIGATGGYRLGIQVRGLASHAGNAPSGASAPFPIAALAIADLHRGGWHGDVRKGRQRGTSNVGVIQGGDATNVVTDRVSVRAEARSHQPRFRQRIVAEIEKAFRKAAAEVKNAAGAAGSVQIEGRLDYESYRLNDKEPCVRLAADAVRALGREPELAVTNGGLDANWLVRHGIPTVSLGCGQLNPHMVSEALLIPDFEDACRIAMRLATALA